MDICSFALLTQAPNITSLQQELTTLLQHEWLPHINQRDYHAGSQGGWDVLALRCAEEYRVAHPILQAFSISAATDWDNLPSLESSPALLQSHSAGEAKQLIDPMLAQLCQLTGLELHPALFRDTEASMTSFGKAVSPTTAAQCAEDPERSRVFIQGIYQAIQDKLKANSNRPVHILYAVTGPFAWLILALLPLFTAKQVRVTLLDIHRASLESVEKLLAYFDVADRVEP